MLLVYGDRAMTRGKRESYKFYLKDMTCPVLKQTHWQRGIYFVDGEATRQSRAHPMDVEAGVKPTMTPSLNDEGPPILLQVLSQNLPQPLPPMASR